MNTTVDDENNDVDNEGVRDEHIFHQTSGGDLSKDCVLLNNQSTLDQFVNPRYLTNIHTVKKPIMVYCNAGSTTTNQKGMLCNFSIWYNLQGIANILSLKTVTDHYLVTYNSNDRSGVFTVHTPKGNIEFICHPCGLHYLDLAQTPLAHDLMAMTIKENYEGYTKIRLMGLFKHCTYRDDGTPISA